MSEPLTTAARAPVPVPQAPPVELFQGFDSFANEARAKAVGGDWGAGGGEARLDYTVCYDMQALQKALDVSGSISASAGFGSASAKASYVHRMNITNTCLSIVIYASKISDCQRYTSARLSKDVLPPRDTYNSVNMFFKAYGDSFVSSITRGAEYAATYIFRSQTAEEQTKIHEEFKANVKT
jgi:hypothetical protein